MDLSITVPTYNEKENIQKLLEKIYTEFKEFKINGEVIIVDDGSPDGTGEIVENLKKKYKTLQCIHRQGKLGLSSAVLDGFKVSKGKVLGVMDADLSHPTEKIPEMFFSIKNNEADFVIGSRYMKGGDIVGWNFKRKVMSRGATLLSRPFTKVKDPMSGFFMIKKECIEGREFNSKGFKILLELIIKAKYNKIKEVPIVFINRTKGKSKAGLGEIKFYIKNLIGYIPYRFKIAHEFIKFAIVGLLGTIINLAILYSFTEFFGIFYLYSAIVAFIVAATTNYIFNKTWTFKERLRENIGRKYIQFFIVSVVGLIVNLGFLYLFTEYFKLYYIVSQIIAILIGFIINFIGNKIWTFSK